MSGFDLHHPAAFTFGILGNIISLMVYLAPLPTFYRIYRKKSTEGFQSLPFVVSLFSSTLWIYYAILKTSDFLLLVTTNGFGCFIQTIYIITFLIFADRSTRKSTGLVLGSLNFVAFGLILALTHFSYKGGESCTRRWMDMCWLLCYSLRCSIEHHGDDDDESIQRRVRDSPPL